MAGTTAWSRNPMSSEMLLSLDSMEGVYALPVETVEVRRKAPPTAWPGYAMAATAAALGFAIHYLPFAPFQVVTEYGVRRPISASAAAIFWGVLIRNLWRSPVVAEGAKRTVKRTLPATIVLTGVTLNLANIATVGATAFSITITCIAAATLSAWYLGKLIGIREKTALCLGVGTAICGTSAIVAAAPLIQAEEEDITLSVGVINLLGLALMFLLPVAGGLLQLSDAQFGVWAGASVHAVPQAVAAGFAYSQNAGSMATLVKLMRVAMLAPFLFVFGAVYLRRQNRGRGDVNYLSLVPTFVWGFLALSIVNTFGLMPVLQFKLTPFLGGTQASVPLAGALTELSNVLLTLAMGAMGLEVNLRFMLRVGGKAMAAGIGCCLALCGLSLLLLKALL